MPPLSLYFSFFDINKFIGYSNLLLASQMVYMLSLFYMFSYSSMLSLWLSIELNMICFIMLAFVYSKWKGDFTGFGMDYFIPQSIGSILLLLYMVSKTAVVSEMWDLLLVLSMSIKLGLFPFHQWVYNIAFKCDWTVFCIMMVLQKLPIVMISYFSELDIIFLILILNMGFGCLKLFMSSSIKYFLVSLSLHTSLWFLLFFQHSLSMGLVYVSVYLLSLWPLGSMNDSNWNTYIPMLGVCYFSSLPPLSPFFLKFLIISNYLVEFSLSVVSLVWIFTFLGTMGAFSYLIKFYMEGKLFMWKSVSSKNILVLSVLIFNFFGVYFVI